MHEKERVASPGRIPSPNSLTHSHANLPLCVSAENLAKIIETQWGGGYFMQLEAMHFIIWVARYLFHVTSSAFAASEMSWFRWVWRTFMAQGLEMSCSVCAIWNLYIYTTGVNDSRNQTKRKETKNMKSGTSPIVSLTGVRWAIRSWRGPPGVGSPTLVGKHPDTSCHPYTCIALLAFQHCRGGKCRGPSLQRLTAMSGNWGVEESLGRYDLNLEPKKKKKGPCTKVWGGMTRAYLDKKQRTFRTLIGTKNIIYNITWT